MTFIILIAWMDSVRSHQVFNTVISNNILTQSSQISGVFNSNQGNSSPFLAVQKTKVDLGLSAWEPIGSCPSDILLHSVLLSRPRENFRFLNIHPYLLLSIYTPHVANTILSFPLSCMRFRTGLRKFDIILCFFFDATFHCLH